MVGTSSLWMCFTLILVTRGPNIIVSSQSSFSGWRNKQADIYFLLDSSSSVWIIDYRKMLAFVSSLVSDMDIGPHKTRVGVGIYSDNFREYIPIDNDHSKEELRNAIQVAPYLLGSTYISRAIQGVRNKGLSPVKTRNGVPLIAVLITDGTSRHKQLTLENATMAKQEGISLFTVGVGWDINRDELRSVASDPKSGFTFLVNSFNGLKTIKKDLSTKMAAVEFLQKDQRGTCGSGDVESDTIFVFDEAANGLSDSTKIKQFIADVANDLSMNSGKVRVGVVSKTCHEGNDINLNSFMNKEDFEFGLLQGKEGPGLPHLLRRAWYKGFLPDNGGRSLAKRRIVLFVTNPLSRSSTLPGEAFLARKNVQAEIFVIRIGRNYDKVMMNKVASSATQIIYHESIDFLKRKQSEFLNLFCPGL